MQTNSFVRLKKLKPFRSAKTASLARNAKGDQVIKITFPFDYVTLDLIRSLDKREFHKEAKCWSAAINESNIRNLVKWSFSLDDKLELFLSDKETKKAESIKPLVIPGLKGVLRPFQNEGVSYM